MVAAGAPADLRLYTDFGVMPVTGPLAHASARGASSCERRAQEIDRTEPARARAGPPERAVAEWKRLEPQAIGHERPRLHEFFGRERTCLAAMEATATSATRAVLGQPGGRDRPGGGRHAQDLVPVVLAALDRVAKTQEPETLALFCATDSWWLLRRLRRSASGCAGRAG